MIRALLFKEWIKLRLWWLLALVASLALALILVFRLRHAVELNGALAVWSAWIDRGYLFFRPYQPAPLVLGVLAAVLQFLPEIQNQRIRLVLHLPLGEDRTLSVHLIAGLVFACAPVLLAYAAFAGAASLYLPTEFQGVLFRTFLPWLLSGAAAYLLTSAALLESHLWNRCLHLLLALGAVRLFMLESFYDGYSHILLWLALWTALLFSIPLYSSLRLRKGLGR